MARVIFASPTYGPVDPQALKSQRVAIMHAASNGHTWVGDASPDRMKFDVARDAVAKTSLEVAEKDGADQVFWCDSDVVLPPYAITKLLQNVPHLDFVTGIYFQRVRPHWPLIAHYQEGRDSYAWISVWPENVVAPIDGCGFGCVLTSTKMLKAIGEKFEHWFHYEKFSEDFDFCRRAIQLGFQPHVDTSVICGHLADPQPISFQHFRQAHPEFYPLEEGQADGAEGKKESQAS